MRILGIKATKAKKQLKCFKNAEMASLSLKKSSEQAEKHFFTNFQAEGSFSLLFLHRSSQI
jgi:hypothetical protein